ncbi:hypothetical protein C4553_00160 [Candidatus Parcubacteria bacterium]|nr:MAG: hypothetical protein C4553_00160 [Candidatus Parcubacteria bacterium]
MKVLGISLGHDTNFAIVEDGKVKAAIEAERYFRRKRYKLNCLTLEPKKIQSTFQYVDTAELESFLKNELTPRWGKNFDAIAVQNQGRKEEFENFKIILKKLGFSWLNFNHIDHHLSHGSLAFYTSPFTKALILSYDGSGNDGHTIVFSADNASGLKYLENNSIEFGKNYNNLGYLLGIKPEICGTTSGKTMGLCSYGQVRKEWLPYAKKYIEKYLKLPYLDNPNKELNSYGKFFRSNAVALADIPELSKYTRPTSKPDSLSWFKWFSYQFLGRVSNKNFEFPNLDNKDAQDLAQTVQHAWTDEVLKLLKKCEGVSENLCVIGGCALNGITNYAIEQSGMFKNIHFLPNPTDCGLASGAALHTYWKISGEKFNGYGEYFSPYLGLEAFDLAELPKLKNQYPSKIIDEKNLPDILAKLLSQDIIVGVIRGRYEVGPRALGNRSILCNPLNPDMRDILNDKVKHREWYRPFAPVVTAEDSHKYFTAQNDVPYMSVICYTKPEWQKKLPSITHVDGSARIQTVRRPHNQFLYDTLKAFEKIAGVPILLNTSFNPAGEPILNYCSVGLEMLTKTKLDMVLINNELFVAPGNEKLLNKI